MLSMLSVCIRAALSQTCSNYYFILLGWESKKAVLVNALQLNVNNMLWIVWYQWMYKWVYKGVACEDLKPYVLDCRLSVWRQGVNVWLHKAPFGSSAHQKICKCSIDLAKPICNFRKPEGTSCRISRRIWYRDWQIEADRQFEAWVSTGWAGITCWIYCTVLRPTWAQGFERCTV